MNRFRAVVDRHAAHENGIYLDLRIMDFDGDAWPERATVGNERVDYGTHHLLYRPSSFDPTIVWIRVCIPHNSQPSAIGDELLIVGCDSP